jgi:hypothetical protein
MSNQIKACYCERCGEQLTKPQFYKGKSYGWTCITLVKPGIKKSKNPWQYKEFPFTIIESSLKSNYFVVKAEFTPINSMTHINIMFKRMLNGEWHGNGYQFDEENNKLYMPIDEEFYLKRRVFSTVKFNYLFNKPTFTQIK